MPKVSAIGVALDRSELPPESPPGPPTETGPWRGKLRQCRAILCRRKSRRFVADFLVELRGFEPVISAMRHPRALDGVPLPTAMAFLRSCANTGAGTIDRTP